MGVSRQGLYKRAKAYDQGLSQEKMIISFVRKTRLTQDKIGMRKLHRMFLNGHPEMAVGRDYFMKICQTYKLTYHLNCQKKRYKSADVKGEPLSGVVPNLVPKGLLTIRSNVIWCSDITYLKAGGEHVYLSLVVDYHSRKIVGWHLSDNMKTDEVIKALDKALQQAPRTKGIIHHSDRGSQYRSVQYQKYLKLHNMTPSMTDGGKPYQNAKVERINGILKHELGLIKHAENIHILRANVAEAIHIYNAQRLHSSLAYLTPNYVHHNDNHTQKLNNNLSTSFRT